MTMATATFTWMDREVRAALGLRGDLSQGGLEFAGVSTDSRTVRSGELYVALVGERFDGHRFVAEALAAGAGGAVVSRPVESSPRARLYPVSDTLVALGRLARHRRRALPATVVAVGGSAGKTSTKELVRAALASGLEVHATEANENNRVGVPLTLLAAPSDADAVVVEMGTSLAGEMKALGAIAEPDLGVVVTVGEEHLEGLGSLEGAIDEELDLLRTSAPGAAAVVGDTPPGLATRARELAARVRVAGWSARADHDLRPGSATSDAQGSYSFRWRGEPVRLRQSGRHVVTNALLALAVADELGVAPASAAAALGAVEAPGLRGEVRRVGPLTLILDCYNSNPQSLAASLGLLAERTVGSGRVALLGSMLELGRRSPDLHRSALRDALGRGLDLVVATGAFARAARELEAVDPEALATGTELLLADEIGAGYALLRERLQGTEDVLLKGSRGVALERLVPRFEADFGRKGD